MCLGRSNPPRNPPDMRRQVFTPAQLVAMAARYVAGERLDEIARDAKCSVTWLMTILHEQQVKMRPSCRQKVAA